jgi:type IV pilus assembly protein PilE
MFCSGKTAGGSYSKIAFVKLVGFHLIELLIALTIISLLTAISLPLYSQHIAHARRLAAEVTLTKLASALEQYYTAHNSYADATLSDLSFSAVTDDGAYHLQIVDADSSQFLIEAAPRQADSACANLRLNSSGEKSISGTGSVAECWR